MDRIRDFLCPHLTYLKLRKRCKILKQQMNRQVESDPVCPVRPNRLPLCEVCKNEDEGNTVIDEAQGIRLCLGPDRLGCGTVLEENRFCSSENQRSDILQASEHFSDQYACRSQRLGNRHFQKINSEIEKNLSRYNREDKVTSDYYKDLHRQEIYDMIDRVQDVCGVDRSVAESVKYMFHGLRTRLYRVHKPEMVVCCLFYMCLCT
jgi:hypothetical protein